MAEQESKAFVLEIQKLSKGKLQVYKHHAKVWLKRRKRINDKSAYKVK